MAIEMILCSFTIDRFRHWRESLYHEAALASRCQLFSDYNNRIYPVSKRSGLAASRIGDDFGRSAVVFGRSVLRHHSHDPAGLALGCVAWPDQEKDSKILSFDRKIAPIAFSIVGFNFSFEMDSHE